MLDRPLDISETHEAAVESYVEDLDERLQNHVADVLNEVENDEFRKQIKFVVFEPTNALPKRQYRPPAGKIQYLIEQLYLGYEPEGDHLGDLLRATIALHEYYDIVDDVIDGDVAAGHELEVIVTNELLLPLFVRHLGHLGSDAVEYWSKRALRTVGSFVEELTSEPSATSYRDLVDRQSTLFGSMTGLSAVVADKDDATVERAAAIGRTYFRYEQFLRDLHQHEQEDHDPWNAWNLMPEDEALAYVSEQREEFKRLIDDLPTERKRLLRPLVATDVDAFRESIR